jgi:beta-mannosidase
VATQQLDGTWKFRSLTGDKLKSWMPMTVPGTVHHHLHKLKKIPDPHWSRNEIDLQWLDEQDWEFTRTVRLGADDCKAERQQLIFDGLDTIAEISVNECLVGTSCNMFRQVVCDVRGILRPGVNEIRVVLRSPTAFSAAQAREHADVQGMFNQGQSNFLWQTGERRDTHRAWIRKVQCHFGWDWGMYLATSGIWQGTRLECANGPRLVAMTVAQEHIGAVGDPDSVKIVATVYLDAAAACDGFLMVACDGKLGRARAHAHPGENVMTAELTIDRPKLWWPAGQGAQPLYAITASWEDSAGKIASSASRRIGLRTLELVTEPDQSPDGKPGESFHFRVNGRPVYAKGANWIPADQFVDRCTPQVYRHLLGGMVEANMNMVRVWGGGWYEQDSFYDLCDELGLLVWQDFMMACALYPDTPGFIAELTREAAYQIRRLHAHPCIALWCGDNENAQAVWSWWKNDPSHARMETAYKNVLGALRSVCEREDTTRRFWLSSPSNNEFGGYPDDPNHGDVHYWAVWHRRQPFSNYLTVKPRFASEFGFQSFPEPRTVRACVPADQMNPSSRVMEHHQRSNDGNMLITNTMAREMPIPKDFDSFCWTSQINQAMAIQTAVEHWRRLKPWCMGAIYWQINDLWPVASWSSIDYHGRWKALHHAAARFYAPLLASMTYEKNTLTVWATSDIAEALSLRGELEIYTWAGKRVARKALSAKLKPNESRIVTALGAEELLGRYQPHEVCCFVRLADKDVSSENHCNLVPWKWVTLPRPKISTKLKATKRGLALSVRANAVTPFFHAEIADTEGHFQDDWRVLRPGVTYDMPWIAHAERGAKAPPLTQAKKRLETLSLYDLSEH